MTFRQIIDDAAEMLGNLQPEARVRYRRFLNEWYRRILSEVTLPRGATATAATVANTATVTLPVAAARVRRIYDATNGVELDERSLDWIRGYDPTGASRGTPAYYGYKTDRVIELCPVPSANGTLTVDYDAVVTELDEDTDVPVIPEDFHYLLGVGIQVNEFKKNSDNRLKLALDEMNAGIRALRFYIAGRAANRPNPGKYDGDVRSSRLGGWYPQGS